MNIIYQYSIKSNLLQLVDSKGILDYVLWIQENQD